jgi:hypothetical protein
MCILLKGSASPEPNDSRRGVLSWTGPRERGGENKWALPGGMRSANKSESFRKLVLAPRAEVPNALSLCIAKNWRPQSGLGGNSGFLKKNLDIVWHLPSFVFPYGTVGRPRWPLTFCNGSVTLDGAISWQDLINISGYVDRHVDMNARMHNPCP